MNSVKDSFEWLHPTWLSYETLSSFHWANSYFLYFIFLIPLLFVLKWLLHFRFRNKLVLAFSSQEHPLFKNSLVRHIPAILLSTSIAFILVALARPQLLITTSPDYSEGIDILIALDISESMDISDLKPNRLKASLEVASDFIDQRPNDLIGLLVFGEGAASLSPLTFDHLALKQWLNEIHTGMMPGSGTAIGVAIATGVARLTEAQGKSQLLILISDGENTTGNISPIAAAKLARHYGITIYSIAIGKSGQVPYTDPKTKTTAYVESHLDEQTLKEVAQLTSGEFFRVKNKTQLGNVFNKIDTLHKSKHVISADTQYKDFYYPYLTLGIIFYLFWLFTKNTFLTNSLED